MIDERKKDHLRICVEEDVQAGCPGFNEVRLAFSSLPEISMSDVDTCTEFLGKNFSAPIIFEAITGGTREAGEINRELAKIAQEHGLGFGVGSQRAMIEDSGLSDTFSVRDVAPDVFLIANLGAVQFNYGYGLDECQKAVDSIGADALALHLNPLQESFQPEGDTDFSNLKEKINSVCGGLDVPVILKGVGSGISASDVNGLKVDAVDVAGVGGTSWAIIEAVRAGVPFSEFPEHGIPTVECLKSLSDSAIPLIASGGVRTGMDVAKSLALGAGMAGMALPLLRAYYQDGGKGVKSYLDYLLSDLKRAMFLAGASNPGDLRGRLL